jgi:hypothetical protein
MSHFLHFTYHLCRLLTGVCVHCNYYKSLNISSLSVLYTFPVTEDVVLMVPPFSSDRRRCSDGPTLFQWQQTLFWWSHPFPVTEDVVLMVPPFSRLEKGGTIRTTSSVTGKGWDHQNNVCCHWKRVRPSWPVLLTHFSKFGSVFAPCATLLYQYILASPC